MAPWRVRDFHADDLDAAVRLWDNPAASSEAPAFGLSDLLAAVRSHEPAVVAVVGEELVGAAVARVSGDRAWVMRISLAPAWRDRGIGSAIPHGELDVAAIVEASRLFTPADIAVAARRTAQLTFERVLFEHGSEEVITRDILHAIGQTRRTLTPELVSEFEQDIQEYARV